jgi:predicted nucleic acid-binding Zn ribbon protein
MMGSRRAPRPVSEAIRAAVEPIAPATPLAAVQSIWPEAVGAKIAAEATPVSERDGVITVACRSATWAQELDLLATQTLEKVRASLPEGVSVEGLRFRADSDLE